MTGAPRPAGAITLREEAADGVAAQALWEEYMADLAERLGAPVGEREDIFATPDAFSVPGSAWVTAYDGERAVGCAGLRRLGRGTGEIKRMFVTADARGRGVGRLLLEELEARAAAAGLRRMRLFTTESLHEARELYEGAGYRVIASPREGARRDYVLEKAL
jgi:GNAT superfamily N-acetyltransferase